MNLSVLFAKDDFDEDETFLKIASEQAYNKLIIEVVLNNKRWFYDHMEMSSTGMMTDEMISFEELIPYEIQTELFEDPKEKQPYVLNLQTKLFLDEVEIDATISRLFLKKSRDTIATADDLHFIPVFFLDSITEFYDDNDVNVSIASDIQEISAPEALKSIKDLALEIVSFGNIKDVEIKLDIFADYQQKLQLAAPVTISEIQGNDVKHTETIPLKEDLYTLFDANISRDIREKKQLILNTEVTYTDVELQEKQCRIQSHIIQNPWCEIMENKVEKHITILKNVLNTEFPSWTGTIKDNEMWSSFRINDDEFQYGVKRGRIGIYLYFREISYDHDFDEVYEEMQKVNKTLDPKFEMIETDNYFNLKGQILLSKLTEGLLTTYIKEMIATSELPAVDKLLGTYQEY